MGRATVDTFSATTRIFTTLSLSMQKTTPQPVLIVNGSRSLSILNVCIFTAISGVMAYGCRTELFHWTPFNPNGVNTIIFMLFLALTALSWLLLFKDTPRLRFDTTGIWKRRHFLSHTLKLVVPWDNISYYTTQVIPSRTISTEDLVIQLKEPDKPVNIDITDSDKGRDVILTVLKFYSERYGFNDFVETLNDPET
jgi:hypothetical protein